MPRTVVLKEAQAPYTLSLEEATLSQETVILKREGRPVAVVVPFGEYEAFAAWRQHQVVDIGSNPSYTDSNIFGQSGMKGGFMARQYTP